MTVLATLASVLSLGLGLARTPYLGVTCPGANNTVCGRVGVAVWAQGRPSRIEARVAGALVRLHAPSATSSQGPWIGYVHLPLGAMGLPARWAGVPVKRLRLRLRLQRAGVWHTRIMRVMLSPGWG